MGLTRGIGAARVYQRHRSSGDGGDGSLVALTTLGSLQISRHPVVLGDRERSDGIDPLESQYGKPSVNHAVNALCALLAPQEEEGVDGAHNGRYGQTTDQ